MNWLLKNHKHLGRGIIVSIVLTILVLIISIVNELGPALSLTSAGISAIASLLYIISIADTQLRISWLVVISSFFWLLLQAVITSETGHFFLVMFFMLQLVTGLALVHKACDILSNLLTFHLTGFLLLIAVFVLKRNNVAGSGIIIILSGIAFAPIALGAALKYSRVKQKSGFVIRLIAGVAVLFGIVGWVFKIQHWPGASAMSYIGTGAYLIGILSIIFILPNSQISKWQDEERKSFYHLTFGSMAFMTFIIFVYFIAPFSMRKIVLEREQDKLPFAQESINTFSDIPTTEKTISVSCLENCD
jgi:hypothetical protein